MTTTTHTNTITTEQVDQLLDAYSEVAHTSIAMDGTYSGRAMFGDTCFAAYGEVNEMLLALAAMEVLGAEGAENLALRMRTDSFGRGVVVYFPGVTVELPSCHVCGKQATDWHTVQQFTPAWRSYSDPVWAHCECADEGEWDVYEPEDAYGY